MAMGAIRPSTPFTKVIPKGQMQRKCQNWKLHILNLFFNSNGFEELFSMASRREVYLWLERIEPEMPAITPFVRFIFAEL